MAVVRVIKALVAAHPRDERGRWQSEGRDEQLHIRCHADLVIALRRVADVQDITVTSLVELYLRAAVGLPAVAVRPRKGSGVGTSPARIEILHQMADRVTQLIAAEGKGKRKRKSTAGGQGAQPPEPAAGALGRQPQDTTRGAGAAAPGHQGGKGAQPPPHETENEIETGRDSETETDIENANLGHGA